VVVGGRGPRISIPAVERTKTANSAVSPLTFCGLGVRPSEGTVNVLRNKTKSVARKHHYVPAFLLQNFTPSGSRNDFLWVHDKQQQDKQWRKRPGEVGFERDYNRVDVPEVDQNAVEDYFATIDGQIAPIIQDIVRCHKLPEGMELQKLISFVALLALRSPSVRNLYKRNMAHVEKERLKFRLARREFFDQAVEEQRREGNVLPTEVTYEKVREYANHDEAYEIIISDTESVAMLLKIWPNLFAAFKLRQWSLLFTRPDEAFLICSDMPVTISTTSPEYKNRFLGFASRGTELTIPLSRSTVLVGSYDTSATVARTDLERVREINRRILSFAERFIYSPGQGLIV
jgi:hypothetical protein